MNMVILMSYDLLCPSASDTHFLFLYIVLCVIVFLSNYKFCVGNVGGILIFIFALYYEQFQFLNWLYIFKKCNMYLHLWVTGEGNLM